MARRRIFWHIGPDDAGTAWLGHALDEAREDLAADDVLVAGTVRERERVTAELRASHRELGLRRSEVEGRSAQLVREVWRHRGTTVLSLPGLASATREQVALAMDGTRGAEHHLVLVQRDLTSQVWAGARAALEQGTPTRAAVFAERAAAGDGAAGSEDDQPWLAYRAGHDLPAIVQRWSRAVLPEIVIGLEGRLDHRGRRVALRDWLSRELLARQPASDLPALPRDVQARLRDTAEEWTDHLTRKGYDVQGTIRAERESGGGRPISSQESASVALADALVEVARLREQNLDLQLRNEHLDRKRRKHKSRAKKLAGRLEQS